MQTRCRHDKKLTSLDVYSDKYLPLELLLTKSLTVRYQDKRNGCRYCMTPRGPTVRLQKRLLELNLVNHSSQSRVVDACICLHIIDVVLCGVVLASLTGLVRYDVRLLKPLSECKAHTIKLKVKNN